METFALIAAVVGCMYGLLILVYALGWNRLQEFRVSEETKSSPIPVSIIIPARNEELNIGACLESVLEQSYSSEFIQILVVNDHSEDRTADMVRQYASRGVTLINLSEYLPEGEPLNSYKKKAIEIAVKMATGKLILTTDADCVVGPKWVETIVTFHHKYHYKFIAAPVAYFKEDSFFKVFQSLDFMTMQGVTGATAALKIGSMCNGANIAYDRQAFLDVGGFCGIDCIASGDDMLLMYKMYKAFPGKIAYLKSPEAIVKTLPVDTFSDFFQQRIRWASKADKYDDKRLTWVLGLVYVWNALLILLFLLGFVHLKAWLWLLEAIVLKTAIELIFLIPVSRFFQKSSLLINFFPSQFLHIPYIVVSGWLGKFGTYQWKSRKVK